MQNNIKIFPQTVPVCLLPNAHASKRTKERIKQKGPNFIQRGESDSGILISTLDSNWLGWLPKGELLRGIGIVG